MKRSITGQECAQLAVLRAEAELLHRKVDHLTELAAEIVGWRDDDDDTMYDHIFDVIQNNKSLIEALDLMGIAVETG